MEQKRNVRLNTPKEITCPACQKIFEVVKISLTDIEEVPGNIAYITAKITFRCTHCNAVLSNRAMLKRIDVPISAN